MQLRGVVRVRCSDRGSLTTCDLVSQPKFLPRQQKTPPIELEWGQDEKALTWPDCQILHGGRYWDRTSDLLGVS